MLCNIGDSKEEFRNWQLVGFFFLIFVMLAKTKTVCLISHMCDLSPGCYLLAMRINKTQSL